MEKLNRKVNRNYLKGHQGKDQRVIPSHAVLPKSKDGDKKMCADKKREKKVTVSEQSTNPTTESHA